MPADLFSEFKSAEKNSWKRQVEKELKGVSVQSINWQIASSLYAEPYYTETEIDQPTATRLHSAQRKTTGWLNMPGIVFETPILTNEKMRMSLTAGADAFLLDLAGKRIAECELIKALHAIRMSDTPVFFATTESPVELYNEIAKGAGYYLKGGIANDPIAAWIQGGRVAEDALHEIGQVIQKTKAMKDFRPYRIESHCYHNAGADAVQELAFMISALVHCVDRLTDTGISALHALNRFFFSVSIGPEYLTEMAKLRALRLLYRKITAAYELPETLCNAFIHTQTSSLHHAVSVSHTNMIRVTSEAVSAVVGGCDALTIQSYKRPSDGFSERIARNVSLVIANETYLGQVADPAAGSYLIDKMSLMLADSAWEMFLKMEEKGGITECHGNGFIQSEIQKSWEQKKADLLGGKVVVGVNKYNDASGIPSISVAESDCGKVLPNRNLSETWLAHKGT